MLETEDVDVDYFTPVASTSLANIFGKSNNDGDEDNTTLKYTPPKPQLPAAPKPEPQKATECLFACALIGYEWFNNVYNSRGKLGFAILKILKSGIYNIVLYDSNKTTLSCTTVKSSLDIVVKRNTISYYDNANKYWHLNCTTEEDAKKIVDLLLSLNAMIKRSNLDETPESGNLEDNRSTKDNEISDINIASKDSDTDSSVNRKTKMSILNRMANMGQSVLPPPQTIAINLSSDSSDREPEVNQPVKTLRRKLKNVTKHCITDKKSDVQLVEAQPKALEVEQITTFSQASKEIVPMTDIVRTNIGGHDMNLFISEQRVNNSELRINMNRIADKVDQILDKVKGVEPSHNFSSSNFQNEIFQKLINEYENKIKMYENVMKTKELIIDSPKSDNKEKSNDDISLESSKNKIVELEKILREKDKQIIRLTEEAKVLTDELNHTKLQETNSKTQLLEEIAKLKLNLSLKDDELLELKSKEKPNLNLELQNKIKTIMNDTFHTISANFEKSESYSGESVKNVIATVIKTVTIESLGSL